MGEISTTAENAVAKASAFMTRSNRAVNHAVEVRCVHTTLLDQDAEIVEDVSSINVARM